jgi:7-cyano-7-deazaguanine synthase
MEQEKSVIILSGGLDSTTLTYDLVNQGMKVYPISFNYKQKHEKELEYATITTKKLGLEHKIVDLSVLNDLAPSSLTRKEWKIPEGHYNDETMKQTVIPNRNMVMLSLATSYAISLQAKKLYYGAHSGDHTIYPDCRKEFVKKLGEAIKICDWNKIILKVPYINISKADIVAKGLKLGVPYEDTWTCYKGLKKACGVCGSCRERLEAFKINNVQDPLCYMSLDDM